MLNETLKTLRKAKGLSQEELAAKLHVVRQTISKWEQGLSVPDAAQLIDLAAALETDVATLLGEVPTEPAAPDDLKVMAAKLELLNEQFAREQERKRKTRRSICIVVLVLAVLTAIRSLLPWLFTLYLSVAERSNTAIIGGADGPTAITIVGTLEFLPVLFCAAIAAAAIVGIHRTRRK